MLRPRRPASARDRDEQTDPPPPDAGVALARHTDRPHAGAGAARSEPGGCRPIVSRRVPRQTPGDRRNPGGPFTVAWFPVARSVQLSVEPIGGNRLKPC
jgi:hypothetical protein